MKGNRFRTTGTLRRSRAGAGIGLADLRERLRELGRRLEVESDASGTLIRAVIEAENSGSAA